MKKEQPFSEEEVLQAEQEAEEVSTDAYKHVFKKPFTYMGSTYTQLTFDFDAMTGKDSLAIEHELSAKGVNVLAPAFSVDYIVRFAARACTTRIGADAFDSMSIGDFNKIRARTRGFLLKAES